MQHTFFGKAQELLEQNQPFAIALVVRAEKPTSGKPGDKALITADGTLYGWIGGSCSQPTVIREALKAMEEGKSRFIRLSPNPEQAAARDGLIDLPITCFSGGTLEIYIEPQYPQPRLMVVGSLPVARALVALGKAMNYDVVEVDPDASHHTATAAHTAAGAPGVVISLDDIAAYIRPDTYVVVATHGNFDEAALERVLKASPRYVGVVASHKRFESILDYLRAAGFGEDDLSRIKAPAGLDIQAQQGDEIALSILAEIVQYRRTAHEAADWAVVEAANTVLADVNAEPQAESKTESGTAVDPVCGMDVDIASAHYLSHYQGTAYYFCGAGCKLSFDQNPESFLTAAPHEAHK